MSKNQITITIHLDADSDPQRIGEAIGSLLRQLVPPEDYPKIQEQIKSQKREILIAREAG